MPFQPETLQHPWELEQLLRLAKTKARQILEIGAWEGGTLREWLRVADKVVVIDDRMRHAREWESWSVGCDLILIQGDCADQQIIDTAREDGPYDLVFLDADHTYEAGRRDWENYRPMVAPGGVFVFHDIRRYEHGDLDRLWAEIKAAPGARTMEFHENVADWGGIGVVWA